MNSTQLHYREATRALERTTTRNVPIEQTTVFALEAVTHALLATVTALQELTRQADPATDAIATAVGVLTPATDNVIRHHAFNAFGSDR